MSLRKQTQYLAIHFTDSMWIFDVYLQQTTVYSVVIGSGNRLSTIWRHTIKRTNDDWMSTALVETNTMAIESEYDYEL